MKYQFLDGKSLKNQFSSHILPYALQKGTTLIQSW